MKKEKEEERKKGRQVTLNALTENVEDFISKALDVKDAFKYKGNRVFYNNKVLAEIDENLSAYSEAYELLNKHRKALVNDVKFYWGDDTSIRDTRDLLDYALEELHKQKMLTSNHLIEDINEFNLGRVKKRKRRKKEISNNIRDFVAGLEQKLDTLKLKKERIIQQLGDK